MAQILSEGGVKPTQWNPSGPDEPRIRDEWRWAWDGGLLVPLWSGGGRPWFWRRGQTGLATAIGSPAWGVNQDGLMFPSDGGANQWEIDSPTWLEDLTQDEWTITAVVRVPDSTGNDGDFVLSAGDAVQWWGIAFDGSTDPSVVNTQVDDDASKVRLDGSIAVDDGQRHVITVRRKAGQYEQLIDGVLDVSAAVNNDFSIEEPIRIGGNQWSGQEPTTLETEAVYIHPFAWSDGQIDQLVRDPFSPFRPRERDVVQVLVGADVTFEALNIAVSVDQPLDLSASIDQPLDLDADVDQPLDMDVDVEPKE